MNKRVQATALIDTSLRFALFGLECAMGLEFSVKEIERVFLDARDDQVSAKDYVFFAADNLKVYGHVDEYEPETIQLHVENSRIDQRLLDSVMERARYQTVRMRTDN
jgi:hypothetical protein